MVIGNLFRAIPGFSNGRMVTEWVIFMNASLATLLIVALPRPMQPGTTDALVAASSGRAGWSLAKTWLVGLASATVLIGVYGWLTLSLYQERLAGKPWANHRRFGPEAKWRISPILKHGEHP
jgi:uncharacterized membrane protein